MIWPLWSRPRCTPYGQVERLDQSVRCIWTVAGKTCTQIAGQDKGQSLPVKGFTAATPDESLGHIGLDELAGVSAQ